MTATATSRTRVSARTELAVTDSPAGPVRGNWRTGRSVAFRARRQAVPVGVMSACQILASVPFTGHATMLAAGASAVCGVAAWAGSRKRRRSARAYAMTSWACGSAWTLTATAAEAGGIMPWLLWGGGSLLAVPYWRRHATPYVRKREPVPAPVPGLGAEEVLWDELLGGQGRVLAGSQITQPERTPHGWTATIMLPPGEKETAAAIAAAGKIASAFGKSRAQVVVEPMLDGNESRARLTVLERIDVLQTARVWAGPTLDPATGIAIVGIFADGQPARFQFWSIDGGACHSLIAGTTGSGKSRFLDLLLCEAHLSPLMVAMIIDPQEGQSLPDWTHAVPRTAIGIEAGMRRLRAVHRIMLSRARHLGTVEWTDDKGRRRHGVKHLVPAPEMPLIFLVIDEAPMLLTDPEHGEEAQRLLTSLSKLARKTGIAIALVTQVPSLDELKTQTLRSMLRSGNRIAFRTGDAVSTGMLGMYNDPSKLPEYFPDGTKTHGLGYLVGPDARQAAYRSTHVTDPYDVSSQPAAGTLDDLSAHADAAEPAPARTTPDSDERDHTPAAAGTPATTTAVELIAALLAEHDEPMQLAEIVFATKRQRDGGYSPAQVKNALRALVGGGRARQVRHGHYQACLLQEAAR